MRNTTKISAITALAMILSGPAFAQGALVGTEALNDRIEDIQDAANEDLARGEDAERFGPNGVAQGWRGSIALTGSAATGNTDTVDVSAAGRLTYGVGDWAHSFGLAFEYGEANGAQNEEEFFATYEGVRYFSPEFYGFGLARYEYDGFATNEHDMFIGAGPGYRFVNTEDATWRLQAGPGVRHVVPAAGASLTEAAAIVSSRAWVRVTDGISLTNDTDILGSDVNMLATNDFGVTFKLTDAMATRLSYRTDYNSKPAPGFKNTDNTFGVSLVVGF